MTKIIKTLKGFNRNITVNLKMIYSDPLIKLKKYADTHTGIGPGLDKNGQPVTGLTEDYEIQETGKKMKTTVPGTRRVMERELGLPEGRLKQDSDFWPTYFVRVGSDPIEMELTSPHDMLKYLFLMAQSIVADGLKAIQTDSQVEFVIYSEEQEAVQRIEARTALKIAYALAENLDMETKINILAVYGEIADASSPNAIIDKIDEKLEEDPSKFLKIAKDGNLVSKSLITKCLDKGILTNKDGAIYHNEIVVGYSDNDAALAVEKDKVLQTILKAKLSGDMELIQSALDKKEEVKS